MDDADRGAVCASVGLQAKPATFSFVMLGLVPSICTVEILER